MPGPNRGEQRAQNPVIEAIEQKALGPLEPIIQTLELLQVWVDLGRLRVDGNMFRHFHATATEINRPT